MNILFSTTRQWNPGDEIVLTGIRNLLDELGIEYTPIIFNRHPLIRRQQPEFCSFYFDNSFMIGSEDVIDYAIFAGSPQWSGRVMEPFFNTVIKNNIRASAIGIGGCMKDPKTHEFFQKYVDLTIVRDLYALTELDEFKPNMLPCPSIFCSKEKPKEIKNLKKIGISFQAHGYCCSPHRKDFEKLNEQYKTLSKEYDCTLICHVYPDFVMAKRIFPEIPAFYSYESQDYIKEYRKYDLVVGTRIHGAGIAASHGIPSICVSFDRRGQTASMLGAFTVDSALKLTTMTRIYEDRLPQKSAIINKLVFESKATYLRLMKHVIGDW